MKTFAIFGTFFLVIVCAFGSDTSITNESDVVQREKLFQRFIKEMHDATSKMSTNMDVTFPTNFDTPFFRNFFNQMVVDPSFGLRWDEVPAPTMTNSNAMAAVEAFVVTNGWNMYTNGLVFAMGSNKPNAIRGLPWIVIHDREFPALTDHGILYVMLTGWNLECNGVAYNPKTNAFAWGIRGFKHIGQHWYAWIAPEDTDKLTQQYEGAKP